MRTVIGVVLGLALILAIVSSPAAGQAPAAVSSTALAGTWRLVSLEQGAAPQALAAVPNAIGLLVHDAAGHVIEIVTRAGRPAAIEPVEQFLTYRAFWGRVEPERGALAYRVHGDVDPRRLDARLTRTVAWNGPRLVLTESAAAAVTRATWERVAELEAFPAHLEEVVGFWQWKSAGFVNATGTMVQPVARDPGVIVYTPTGLMSVLYLPAPGRKAFAGPTPTADEARAAMRDIPSYFAAYVIQPQSRVVLHYQLGPLNPAAAGTSLERNFEISGSQLVLRFPPSRLNGEEVRNTLFLERLSGIAEMWPARRR